MRGTLFVVLALVFAGCAGSSEETRTDTKPALGANRGGIQGFVIDDIYRPIPAAKIVVSPAAITVTADNDGVFQVTDLVPGTYTLIMEATGFEAAPHTVDVEAGVYVDKEINARRISSDGSRIVTTQYSVFIPCSIDFVVNGIVEDCTGDASGDSFRATFRSNYKPYGANVTYLLTEMKANKENRYEVQVRYNNGGDYQYFSVSQFEGRYTRLVMPYNGTSQQSAPASYGDNLVWTNNRDDLDTILFTDSVGREELQGAGVDVCCGAGVHLAIKANFIQSLFLGEPETPIDSYRTMSDD